MFFDPNSTSSKALRTEVREILPDRMLENVSVEFFLRGHMDDCRERRSHIHHPRELVIPSRFDAAAVENDRHASIDIVRTTVLRDLAREPVVEGCKSNYQRGLVFIRKHVQPAPRNSVVHGISR